VAHVYATVESLKKAIVEGGSDYGTADDVLLLNVLGSVSRGIDTWCRRTRPDHPMSGFGPRTGTNRYDGTGSNCLELDDDLLSISSVTTTSSIGGGAITVTDETDFYKRPYDRSPYRELDLHENAASTTIWYRTRRGTSVAGSWGYQDVRVTSASTTAEALDLTETGVDVTAGTDFEIGQTMLVESEQMSVTGITTNTLTVVRGANGTTAATHNTGAAIGVYQYPEPVVQACRLAALRRWRTRDAGSYGSELSGGGAPGTVPMLSDTPIFSAHLVEYRLRRA
jgi:hypothetical protein